MIHSEKEFAKVTAIPHGVMDGKSQFPLGDWDEGDMGTLPCLRDAYLGQDGLKEQRHE